MAEARAPERPGAWHAYRVVLGSRLRAQSSYRASFVLDVLGSGAITLVEFSEVYVIFHNVPVLGGLDFRAAALVYALAALSFSLGDLLTGDIDRIPVYVRSGNLDTLLVRPLPLLAQLVTGDVQLRRLGRVLVALGILAVVLPAVDVAWSPAQVGLLAMTPLAGAMVFSGLFVAVGGAQFWLVEGGEFANAFTYGSSYAASFSPAVLTLPLRLLFSFVLPAAFTGYLPAIALLGLPGPPWLPAWLGWLTPVAGVLTWAAALALWRLGVRRYTGAGG